MLTEKIARERSNLLNNNLQPWLVCLSAALFFFYELIQMGMFNALAPELMREFKINATQLGNLSATYFYADIAFLLIAGILIDKFSVRTIILCAGILCTIATFLFSFSVSPLMAGISHFMAGVGNAFCFLSCIKLCSRWFPSNKLALIVGITVTIAMCGGIVAQTPLIMLSDAIGWRKAVLVNGFLGVLIVAINWYFLEDYPKISSQSLNVEKDSSSFSFKDLGSAMLTAQNWLCGLYTCLLNLPIFLLGDLWGVMYLVQVHHIPKTSASYITSMIFLGTMIGSPIVGWFSDYVELRRIPMIIGAFFSLTIILTVIYVPELHFTALLLLFLALGVFTSAQVISYPTVVESNPKKLAGTATSLASILIMGGGAVFQPMFGWLMEKYSNGHAVNNIAAYSSSDFMRGMMIMPIAFAIGLLVSFLIRETNCLSYKESLR